MSREITQRELHNESGEIMRELDRGESFLVTRNGAPVGELSPVRRRQFVPVAVALEAFGGAAAIDSGRFRRDIDRVLDQSIVPRG
jgi:antitoxin (DNA-binding transcriptional repressor) of toxin-antitoxin stability system